MKQNQNQKDKDSGDAGRDSRWKSSNDRNGEDPNEMPRRETRTPTAAGEGKKEKKTKK